MIDLLALAADLEAIGCLPEIPPSDLPSLIVETAAVNGGAIAELGSTLSEAKALLSNVHQRLMLAESTIEALMVGQRTQCHTITEQTPAMRVRIQHTHTLKEGHRLSETTVEWCGPGEPDWFAIRGAQRTAFASGTIEAQLRNKSQPEFREEMD